MATTVDNSPEARLSRLQAQWQWNTATAKNLASSVSNWTTNTWTPLVSVNNPDGTPVNAVNPTPTNTVVPPTPTQATTNQVSAWEQANANVWVAATNIGSTAVQEVASQANVNMELGATDKQQLATKQKNATDNQTQFEAIQNQQIIDKTANEIEYQKQQQEDTNAELASTRLLQAAENDKQAATAAEMKIKNDNAEKEATITNDVAVQTSAIAFAKLGLSFSWSAINTSQQIFAQWARNISELKSSNAKNYADLMYKINSTAFDHQTVINKIVSDAHDNEFKSKERLREFIWNTQNNILTSKKQSQDLVQKAIDDYKVERQTREDKLFSDMNSANARLLTATKEIQATVNVQEKTWKDNIDRLVKNWQWASLSPEQKADYELKAWLPPNTTSATIKVGITQGINDRLKAVVWKTVSIPPVILNKMHGEIQQYMGLGYPQATAIQLVTDKYKNSLPDVKVAAEAARAKAAVEASKVALNEASAKAKITTSEAAKTRANKVSSSSWWAKWAKPWEKWKGTADSGWVSYDIYESTITWDIRRTPVVIDNKITTTTKPWTTSTTSAILNWIMTWVWLNPSMFKNKTP